MVQCNERVARFVERVPDGNTQPDDFTADDISGDGQPSRRAAREGVGVTIVCSRLTETGSLELGIADAGCHDAARALDVGFGEQMGQV